MVAILGILGAMALPTYQRFTAQSRQKEAIQNLADYYSKQKSFYAEFSQYKGHFVALGYNPEGALYYRIRSANESPALTTPFSTDPNCTITWQSCVPATYAKWTEVTGFAVAVPASVCMAAVMAASFLACASSDPTLSADMTKFDVWSIDQQKQLSNAQNGLP